MKLSKIVLLCLVLVIAAPVANASQEHVLQLNKFRLVSVSQTDPGTVVVDGSQDQSGKFQEVNVKLLGKTIAVPPRILQQIPAGSNGVIISSEPGYDFLGGRTVYITFLVTWSNARNIYKRFVIAVSEDGKSEIIKY